MRTELSAKFIQHLNRKHLEKGFTLIELLVVIVIIGILSTIAISSLFNQNVKAKQTEAKQNIALINKNQNSYRAENSSFASSFDVLGLGNISGNTTGSTTNYSYTIGGSVDTFTITASPSDTALRGYSGGGVRFANPAQQSVIGTVLCEMKIVGTVATTPSVTPGSTPTCINATQNTLSL